KGFMMKKNNENSEKLKELNESIAENPDDAKAYYDRAFLIYPEQTQRAISDLTKAIELDPENAFHYGLRGYIYKSRNDDQKAISDLTKAIELKPEDASFYKLRAENYKKTHEYEKAFEDYEKAIEGKIDLELNNDVYMELLVEIAYMNFKKHKYDKINKYIEQIHSIDDAPLKTYKKFKEMADYYDKIEDYESELELYKCVTLFTPDNYNIMEIREELNDKLTAKLKKDHKINIIQARIEERNKIIADLSHSIKNMLGTVIDPLENLRGEKEVKPKIIDNAIRGANLIREIVNAMNLSFKGSYEDFAYDSKHNEGEDSLSIELMIIEALKHSVSNMFDSKYFGNFMRNYFPTKVIFTSAKSAWKQISNSNEIAEIEKFMNEYLFKTDFVLESAEKFVTGNEKGSAIKLQILFQEIIFNAVKYVGFANFEDRILKIHFTASKEKVALLVENSYKPAEKTKTTGLGHVVIENFSKLLRTKPEIKKTDKNFSLQVKFHNFWQKI
ncbi:MAG: hypothetical protein U9P79_01105, partial [Candidatus Cloacimonadota bacterium]|nr:hypothetical protein [Candidatus Cloacimonadota bacterium]